MMGWIKPWYGKEQYWTKKKAKAQATIIKNQAIIKVCEAELEKLQPINN